MCYNDLIFYTFESDMTFSSVDIPKQLAKMKQMLAEDKAIPESFKVMAEMLVLIIELLLNQRGLNSQNSSKPPSTDTATVKNKKNHQSANPAGSPDVKGRPSENPKSLMTSKR